MILALIAFLGGVLTIVSPCVLPVLPFVFARAGRSFSTSTLPMLSGMALTFALVATLAAVGGGWAIEANTYGRYLALLLLGAFGLILLVPTLSDRLARPLVAFGARLSQSANDREAGGRSEALTSLAIGVATGFLWAPCAGPILGLILTGAALSGPNVGTSLLLLAYALGAASSMALALLVGKSVFATMKRSLGAISWLRRGVGAIVIVAVVAIAAGADTGFLTQVSRASTASLEQGLVHRFRPQVPAAQPVVASTAPDGVAPSAVAEATPGAAPAPGATPRPGRLAPLPVEGTMPPLTGAVEWMNSPPLTRESLKGKVVLVDFWTYSCINCLRSLPYVRAWAKKYRDQGLVVIGVHTPEFAFEKVSGNVRSAVRDLQVDYPVALDNGYSIWRAFGNESWPAHYFIDSQGRIRHHQFGEGDYANSERIIQLLLAEAGAAAVPRGTVAVKGTGVGAAADMTDIASNETYLGWKRFVNFVDPDGPVADVAHLYVRRDPMQNEWGLTGTWTVKADQATLNTAGGSVYFRFHARDLHLVLSPGAAGRSIRFRITIDGKPPGLDHGADVDADGNGTISGTKLYQLVRQRGAVTDRVFDIQFLDPGVQAFSFTFG